MIKVVIEHSQDDGPLLDHDTALMVINHEHDAEAEAVWYGAPGDPTITVKFTNQHAGNMRRLVEDALRHLRKQTLDQAIEP